jgi:hypothetical protein
VSYAKPIAFDDLPSPLVSLVETAAERLRNKTWRERRLLLLSLMPEWLDAQDRVAATKVAEHAALMRQVLTGFMVRDLLKKIGEPLPPQSADHAFLLGLSFDTDAQRAAHSFFAEHTGAFEALANEHKPSGPVN